MTAPAETGPACCTEPGCRRSYPISIYLADFSNRVFAGAPRWRRSRAGGTRPEPGPPGTS